MTSLSARAKGWLRRRIGYYRLMEARNKVVLGPATVLRRHLESTEVSRLAAGLSHRPEALVVTVIPTYRRPDSLLRAVRSALAQTVVDHVVVVVDDGGGLPAMPVHPRLVAVSLSKNMGIAGVVRNVGIRLSVSEYVAFLDDDNEWAPEHLEVALAALRTGPVPGVHRGTTTTARWASARRVVRALRPPLHDPKGSIVDTNAFVVREALDSISAAWPAAAQVVPQGGLGACLSDEPPGQSRARPVPTVRYLVNPASYYRVGRNHSRRRSISRMGPHVGCGRTSGRVLVTVAGPVRRPDRGYER